MKRRRTETRRGAALKGMESGNAVKLGKGKQKKKAKSSSGKKRRGIKEAPRRGDERRRPGGRPREKSEVHL